MTWYQCEEGGAYEAFEAFEESHICEKCKPVALIDPEDAKAVARLVSLYIEASRKQGAPNESWMHAALREFANPKPPKPEEPTGLGAVVEDRFGDHWVLTERASTPGTLWWQSPGLSTPHWDSVHAVKVLSLGVTE